MNQVTANPFVDETSVVRALDRNELHELGRKLDAAIAVLASGAFERDSVVLAHLASVEGFFHASSPAGDPGGHGLDYEALVQPVIDKIAKSPPYNASSDNASADSESLQHVQGWAVISQNYYNIISALINALQGRMACGESSSGTLLFYPVSDFVAELRGRWFERCWRRRLLAAGASIIPANFEAVIANVDHWVQKQDLATGICLIPPFDWYETYCAEFAETAVVAQFASIGAAEVWGGLNKEKVVRAVTPLYTRAFKRLFVHLRAFKVTREVLSTPAPRFLSFVERVSIDVLQREVAASARLSDQDAAAFVESLIRRSGERKNDVVSYPLIPLRGKDVAFMPSAILFTNWPFIRQQASGKDAGDYRNERYTNQIEKLFISSGFHLVCTDLKFGYKKGNDLTDLDLVVVSDALDEVLVIQLKSFVTPLNLLTLDRADRNISEALEQCAKADANLQLVRSKIEAKFGIALASDCQLLQIIAVEATTGTRAPSGKYPVVTLDWLEYDGLPAANRSIRALWENARDLPAAQAFFQSVAPLFELFDLESNGINFSAPIAVASYTSG